MAPSTALSRTEIWSLLALVGTSIGIVANSFHGDGEPLAVSLAFSLFAFAATFSLIRWLGPSFMKVGLKGKDMSKAKRPEMYDLAMTFL
jgi:UDP-N-acetylglucosamine--dolichyl-phosphate N-acetylglucosaminephosphotransferase